MSVINSVAMEAENIESMIPNHSELLVYMTIVLAVSATIASVAAVWTIKITQKAHEETLLAEKIANIPEFLVKEYWDRTLPPNRGNYKTLRDGRHAVEHRFTRKEHKQDYLKSVLEEGSCDNIIVYEISLALERVGMMVFIGAIPMDIVLASNAPLIVQDWSYCSELVKKIREDTEMSILLDREERVGLQRIHGEWLAYTAAIYMEKNNYKGNYVRKLIEEMGGIDHIKESEGKLRKFMLKSVDIPKSTKKKIENLLR